MEISVFSKGDRFYLFSFNLVNLRNLPYAIRPNFIMSHLEDEDPINVLRQGLALFEAEKVLDVRYGSIKKRNVLRGLPRIDRV